MMNLRSASLWSYALLAAGVITVASSLSWWLAGLDARMEIGSAPTQVIDRATLAEDSAAGLGAALQSNACPNRTQDAVTITPATTVVTAKPSSTEDKMRRLRANQGRTDASITTSYDPATPGNFMVSEGQFIGVERHVSDARTPGVASVDFVFAPVNTPADVDATPLQQASASSSEESAKPHSLGRGFTQEEELFRAHWGWAAYDVSRRAAQQIAQEDSTTTSSSLVR